MKKSDSGIALVTLVLLMLVVAVIGAGLIFTVNKETRHLTRTKKSNSALYLAEAGVEYAIDQLANVSTSYRGPTNNTLGDGEYIVSVTTGTQTDYYVINSTGYVPNSTSPEVQRSLEVTVQIGAGVPDEAVRTSGVATLESNVTLYGIIRSNDQIIVQSNVTLKPDSNGNAAIYTSTGIAEGVSIGTNFRIDPDDEITTEEIRVRGPKNDWDGDPADDAGSGIWKESNIVEGSPLLVEEDTSEKTEPMDEVSYIDETQLLNDVDEDETYSTRQIYESNVDFYLDNKTFLFEKGVEFRSNVNFHGQGTLVVDTNGEDVSMYDYGIEFRSNVYGPTDGSYATVNLVVLDGNWAIKDILLNSNVKIAGLIQGSADIEVESNVSISGLIIADGDLSMRSNVSLIWAEPTFAVPTETADETTIISWKEVK